MLIEAGTKLGDSSVASTLFATVSHKYLEKKRNQYKTLVDLRLVTRKTMCYQVVVPGFPLDLQQSHVVYLYQLQKNKYTTLVDLKFATRQTVFYAINLPGNVRYVQR